MKVYIGLSYRKGPPHPGGGGVLPYKSDGGNRRTVVDQAIIRTRRLFIKCIFQPSIF